LSANKFRVFFHSKLMEDLRTAERLRQEVEAKKPAEKFGRLVLCSGIVAGIAVFIAMALFLDVPKSDAASDLAMMIVTAIVAAPIGGGIVLYRILSTKWRVARKAYSKYWYGTVLKRIGTYVHPSLKVTKQWRLASAKVGSTRIQVEFRDGGDVHVRADFNKHLSGTTLVAPKKLADSFGEEVFLEESEFTRLFDVRGHDQVEARYILSPALMDRLAFFQKKWGNIFVRFSGARVDLRVETSLGNNFMLGWFSSGSPLKFETVYPYYRLLALPVEIVEDLNLNTRIWTKE
jgi:hypothetical protein